MDYFFTREKLQRRLDDMRHAEVRATLALTDWKMMDQDLPSAQAAPIEVAEENWRHFKRGESWGRSGQSVWFRFHFTIPADFAGWPVLLRFASGQGSQFGLTGFEGMVYVNGRPLCAVDFGHPEVELMPRAKGGERFLVALRAYSGIDRPPICFGEKPGPTAHPFEAADVLAVDDSVRQFVSWISLIVEGIQDLPEEDTFRRRSLKLADEAMRLVDFARVGSDGFYESVSRALEMFSERAPRELGPQGPGRLNFVGHAHLDTAWLWRTKQSRYKALQTFTTALEMMRRFGDYRFMASQAQHYEWFREQTPERFAELLERIREGRWEANGAMWVEPDCNVPSGESLVRQLLYGKRFFRDQLGVDCRLLWLPDVFGYSAALPQILKKAGVEYFITAKLAWNQYNPPPHNVFRWQGIDGTEIVANLLNSPGGYCGTPNLQQSRGAWESFRQKDLLDEVIFPFGYGDGGGGPNAEHIDAIQKLKGLAHCPLPVARPVEKTLDEYAARRQELPAWVGELYFERHRGTYTTQARVKKANRALEGALASAELISSIAWLLRGAPHDAAKLEKAWKLLLLNQFHDILPGSSIHEVYEDTMAELDEAGRLTAEVSSHAAAALTKQADKGGEEGLLLVNPLGWQRADPIELPLGSFPGDFSAAAPDGRPLTVQKTRKGGLLIESPGVPSLGFTRLKLLPGKPKTGRSKLAVLTEAMENEFFRLAFDESGRLKSVFDKRAGREVLAGPAELQFFEDKPLDWDAWDIDIFFKEKMFRADALESAEVVEAGPLRASVRFVHRFRSSRFEQVVSLWRDVPRIDFFMDVDWRERAVLVKAAFPVLVHSPVATYEIQFGTVERATHSNTSWELAQFEVCGHRFADLSEAGYGVALANDCKYGYDIKGNLMRLTLLRGPSSPDPVADLGRHEFAYSLIPHQGDWREGNVLRLAHQLNRPVEAFLLALQKEGDDGRFSLVEADTANAVIETVKRPEDGRDGLIVRLYEAHGGRSRATLTFGRPLKAAHEVNLLEEKLSDLEVAGSQLTIELHPYEIRTFLVYF